MSQEPRAFSLAMALTAGALASLTALGMMYLFVPEIVAGTAGLVHGAAGLLLPRPAGQAAGRTTATAPPPATPPATPEGDPWWPPPAPISPTLVAVFPDASPTVATIFAPPASAPEGPVESAVATATPAPSASAISVSCGVTECAPGYTCCSPRCGICVAPGEICNQQACGYGVVPGSARCGANTCNVGQVCCNASCGICADPGAPCSLAVCDDGPTFPVSQECGMSTCNVGSVCCDARCGLCAPVLDCANLRC